MAANVQAICNAYKIGVFQGIFDFRTGAHTLKAALYFQNSGLGFATSGYGVAGEVTGTNYTAGGLVVPNATGPQISGTTSYWTPSATITWNNLTIGSPFDAMLLYDVNAGSGNLGIGVFTFPAQTANNSTFSITMPPNISTSALIQAN